MLRAGAGDRQAQGQPGGHPVRVGCNRCKACMRKVRAQPTFGRTLFLNTSSANNTLSVATRLLLLLHSCQVPAAGAEVVEQLHVPHNMQSRRSPQE